MQLVLASSSPARLATLRGAGARPVPVVPDVDETAALGESIGHLTARLAQQKCRCVIDALNEEHRLDVPSVVLGCDTLLETEGHIYGKPGTPEAAIVRWYRMRGRQGIIHTGHHVVVVRDGTLHEMTRVATTVVTFADLSDAEIARYVATGEPQVVAGGFTIDGFGGPFITRIEGDPHNVVGISLPLVRQMLLDLGVGWFDLLGDHPQKG